MNKRETFENQFPKRFELGCQYKRLWKFNLLLAPRWRPKTSNPHAMSRQTLTLGISTLPSLCCCCCCCCSLMSFSLWILSSQYCSSIATWSAQSTCSCSLKKQMDYYSNYFPNSFFFLFFFKNELKSSPFTCMFLPWTTTISQTLCSSCLLQG